jgi:hypothetical protein
MLKNEAIRHILSSEMCCAWDENVEGMDVPGF